VQENPAEAERRIEEARRTQAESLDLGDLALSELPVSLGELVHLKRLYLGKKKPTNAVDSEWALYRTSPRFTDLSPLAELQGLQSLNLSRTAVMDLTPLVGLQGLQSLDLSRTAVMDLAPLAGLQGLQSLDLSRTAVMDLAPLAGLQGLQSLDLSNTSVTDLKPLAELQGLQKLNLFGCRPSITAFRVLANHPRLAELGVDKAADVPRKVLSHDYSDNCLPRLRTYLSELDLRAEAVLQPQRGHAVFPEHNPGGSPPPRETSDQAVPTPLLATPTPHPIAAPVDPKAAALARIAALLGELMAPTNPHLSAFKMTQRLLAKHVRIPDAMFQSIYPYLEEVRDKLVPALRLIVPYQGITEDVVQRLEIYCNDLLRVDPSMREEIQKKMERLPRFLEAVQSVVSHGGSVEYQFQPVIVIPPLSASEKPREVYISYAWGDETPEGRRRTQVCDDLYSALAEDGFRPIRDRDQIRPGNQISAFIRQLTGADHVVAVISDKYLRSSYCMTEIHGLWQRSQEDAELMAQCVVPIVLPEVKIEMPRDRASYLRYWREQKEELEELFREFGPDLDPGDLRELRLVRHFAQDVAGILRFLQDVLMPRKLKVHLDDGFQEVREALRRQMEVGE
jgi:internalin A